VQPTARINREPTNSEQLIACSFISCFGKCFLHPKHWVNLLGVLDGKIDSDVGTEPVQAAFKIRKTVEQIIQSDSWHAR
jgi:hypothetical protein